MELPDDIAHINYNKTHATYVLFVLSPALIAGFRWIHRAHFLVRQREKAIASTRQVLEKCLFRVPVEEKCGKGKLSEYVP